MDKEHPGQCCKMGFFLPDILDLLLSHIPWQFSLAMQKEGENTTAGSRYIESAESPSAVLGSALTQIYFRDDPDPCRVDDDLNSLKLRVFAKETYFNMVSAIITSASILSLLSPASFPIYNVKFATTTLKPPCCAQGKGTSPFMQEAAVPVPMQP